MYKFKIAVLLILSFIVMSTIVYSEEIQSDETDITVVENESNELVLDEAESADMGSVNDTADELNSTTYDISPTFEELDPRYLQQFGTEGRIFPTGNYSRSDTDLTLLSAAFDFDITRTFNSQSSTGGKFGNKWKSVFDISITSGRKTTKRIVLPNGREEVFNRVSLNPLVYEGVDTYNTLTCEDGYFYYREIGSEYSYKFEEYGTKILAIVHESGKSITFTHNTNNITMTDSTGNVYVAALTSGRISSITCETTGTSISYNYSNSKLTSVVKNGVTIKYEYDSLGRIICVKNAEDQIIEEMVYISDTDSLRFYGNEYYETMPAGLLKFHKDETGFERNYYYAYINSTNEPNYGDFIVRTISVGDNNVESEIVTDENGDITSVKYAYGSAVSNPWGDIIPTEESTYTYDEYHNMTSSDNTYHGLIEYTLDDKGRISYVEYEDMYTVFYSYNNMDKITSVIYSDGKSVLYVYDTDMVSLLYRVESIYPSGLITNFSPNDVTYNNSNYIIDSYTYYNEGASDYRTGLLYSHTDPEGYTTTYRRETWEDESVTENGNITSIVYPDISYETYTYDNANRMTSKTTYAGYTTTYEYDGNNNLIRETFVPTGAVTRYIYDTSGRLVQMVEPAQYNSANDNISAGTYSDNTVGTRYIYSTVSDYKKINPDGYAISYNMGSISGGIAVSESFPYFFSDSSAASADVLTHFYNSNGDYLSTSSYGDNGFNKEEYRGGYGQWVDTGYATYIISKSYRSGDAYTQSAIYYYDSRNNLLKIEYSDGTSESFQYTMGDKLCKYIDCNGNVTEYSVTALMSFATMYNGNNAGSYREELYNRNGKLTSVSLNNTVTESYAYDYAGRVISSTVGLKKTEYDYDSEGRIIQTREFTSDTDYIVTNYAYSYNSIDKTLEVTAWRGVTSGILYGSDSISVITQQIYDKSGNLIKMIDGNGNVTVKTYDSCGRETSSAVVIDDNTNITLYTCTYDAYGNILRYTDGNGNVTINTYDVYGNPKTVTDAEGNTVEYLYTSTGVLLKEQLASNNEENTYLAEESHTSYEYDSRGRLIKVFNNELTGDGISSHLFKRYDYDGNGNVTAEYDANNVKVVENSYNYLNQLITVKEPFYNDSQLIETSSYTYDNLGNVHAIYDHLLGINTFMYDLNGNVTSRRVEIFTVEEYTYDRQGKVLSSVNSNGNMSYVYNEFGMPWYIYTASGTGIPMNTVERKYDAAGNLVYESDSTGKTMVYTYDKLNRATALTVSGNGETYTYYWSYDNNGNIVSETDAEGIVTTYTYDGNNNVLTRTRAGKTTTNTYDENNNLLTVTDHNGVTSTYTYDYLGRVLTKRNADGVFYEAYTYDNNGNVATVNDGMGTDTYTYSTYRNELRQITDSLNRVKYRITRNPSLERVVFCIDDYQPYAYSFDIFGNTISVGHYYGDYEFTAVDNNDYLITPNGFANSVEKMTYDDYGNVLTRTNARGNTTTYEYNCQHLVTEITYPADEGETALTETYAYNADKTLNTKTKRDGAVEVYTYDLLGRNTGITVTENGTVTGTKTFTYDKNGNLLSDGTVTKTYDAFGRVLTQSQAGFDTVTYEYDIPYDLFIFDIYDGYMETVSSNELDEISYGYNSDGQLKVTFANGITNTYSYNSAGLCTSKYVNDSSISYVYNTEGQITRLTDGSTVFDYTYDTNANMLTETRTENGTVKCVKTYTYDKANRLLSETNSEENIKIEYVYDTVGNLLSKTTKNLQNIDEIIGTNSYTYNSRNEIGHYNYDANGNTENTGPVIYGYDGFDRVTSYRDLYDNYNINYEYASNNLRTKAIYKDAETGNTNKEIRYLYDKIGNILAEKNGNSLVNVYVYGIGLENYINSNSVFRYVKNAHGDVIEVYTDTVEVNSYDYDAYGNVIDCSETVYNPIRYAGYYYDADTENYYLKNRYYDSSDARFLTEDPYWNVYNMLYGNATDSVIRNVYYPAVVQSGNRFAYCAGKPIKYTDASGLSWLDALLKLNHYYAAFDRYNSNRKLEFSGYIDNQYIGNAAEVEMGTALLGNNACGWIATYNAFLNMGEYCHPADIVLCYELGGHLIANGTFGVMPSGIHSIFLYSGYDVSTTLLVTEDLDEKAQSGDTAILCYIHEAGAHYVNITYDAEKEEYIVHNDNFEDNKTISSFLESNDYTFVSLTVINKED